MTEEPIELIPISEILILNPRSRNKITFDAIVASIRAVGLKRPISVSRRSLPTDQGHRFDLICGQGRMEAFLALGETAIPAIVREVTKEECLLRSLAENIARRQPSPHALYREVRQLRTRGYKATEISKKLGIHVSYIRDLINLLDKGETQLLKDVEMRRVPLSVAVTIASGTDADVQRALSEAYQSGELRGHRLQIAKRVIARRSPASQTGSAPPAEARVVTPAALIKEYRRHTNRQRVLVEQAVSARKRVLKATAAMKQLLSDDNFKTLLRAESLLSMPARLQERMNHG
jgi:ParB family transcriptional regulator, chromosome partitioning protein